MKDFGFSISRCLALFLCIVLLAAGFPAAVLANGYLDIGVVYNHQGVRADVGQELTLKVKTDLPSGLASGAPTYQWYKAESNYYGTGTAIPDATDASYKAPTDTTGLAYYYCVVTANLINGTTVSSECSDSPLVRVNVQNIGDGFDAYNDGEFETYISYWSGEEFTFSPGQMNDENKAVTYRWYECDADGFPVNETLNNGRAFFIYGIPDEKMMQPIYYKCVATADSEKSGIEMDEVLFSAVLYPMGVEEPIPFTDVPKDKWYYNSVVDAYQMGLINGKTSETYCPNDNVTNAEVVKLAVCMNILYNGGDPATDIANGSPWYKTYMDYAVEHDIIMYEMSATANNTCPRDLFVYILSHALPKEAFTPMNNIPDGAIPDVTAPGTELDSYELSIYTFYRAGILNGSDAKGTFDPHNYIQRSEVAAILIRMMDPSVRVEAPSELAK